MFEIQIRWTDGWVTVQKGFASRDAAEWATAKWKMKNNCAGDPFRAIRSGPGPEEVTPEMTAAYNDAGH